MIEGYYLETLDRLFFAVKGFEHPPDRIVSVLRYAPDSLKGDRIKRAALYRRYYHFSEQTEFLQARHPEYLAYLPAFRATLQSVPKSRVRHVYDPRRRLEEIMRAHAPSTLEKDAADFTGILQSQAGVAHAALGITGSLLIGLHTEKSDLDAIVFGTQSCEKIHNALKRLLDTQSIPELRRLDLQELRELYAERVADTQMGFHDFLQAEQNKVNQGKFRDRIYFIRFVKDAHEIGEIYGDRNYFPSGRVKITARVMDDRESIFTPCKYLLSDVRILEGPQVADLNEVVSFRGRFCEQARAGEPVIATGTLERVQSSEGAVRHRLILGNSPQDCMLVPAWLS